jgi:hypothetical protein
MTASAARSQTISRTAPKFVDCPNFLAAIPSNASKTEESPANRIVSNGCYRYVKMASMINKYRK